MYVKAGQSHLFRRGWPASFSMIKRRVHQSPPDMKKLYTEKKKTDAEKIEKSTAIQ